VNTAIIVSEKDIAGLNIKENLLELFPFKEQGVFETRPVYVLDNVKLYTVEQKSIYCEDIDKKIDADFFLFATKHQAKSGIPSLSVHTQGNWGKAEFGGRDRQLCIAPANYLKTALFKLHELSVYNNYEIIQECTHHGPYLEKPTMFIEIGSSEEQWKNPEQGRIIAKTIISLLTNPVEKSKVAFGIGGLHHTPNFKKVMRIHDIAFGHVCPKYNLQNLDKEMIHQAIAKTQEPLDYIILDWKGLGQEKQRILDLLKELNLEYKRTDQM
jgi:D-aminoacyl-tRNA deacylase